MIDAQHFTQQITQQATAGAPTLADTYLFYGQTPFLSEENAQVLVSAAKKQGFSQREIFYLDNRTKFQPILASLQSPGLFDPKKVIELRFDSEKPTKKIGEQVAEIAQHQSANLLIIQAGNLPYNIQKEKWFKRIRQTATAVVAKPIYPNQLPNWVHQRAEYLHLQLSAEALKTIIRFSEGNLLWTNQILMQLAHSDYPQPIAGEVIESMLADMSVFQIEDLVQALLNKNPQAIKITQKLAHENESLIFITTVLYREFATLNQIVQSGKPFVQACKALRVWQNKQRAYQSAINKYNAKQFTVTLRQLALLDKINKGQHRGDGWLLLTHTVSQLLLADNRE